jgi:hypothetical protein
VTAPRAAPRPWRAIWWALVEDFGMVPLVIFVALALGIAAWAVVDLTQSSLFSHY